MHVEIDLNPGAVLVGIAGRKVAQDAALDDLAFGDHGDGLGHLQIAIALDLHVADKARDALGGAGRRQGGCQQKQDEAHAFEHGHGHAPERLMEGTAADAASIWKKCSSR